MSKGYVYILTNPSMPGLVKVGKTTGSTEARAAQLHQTGVPLPFLVAHYVLSPDCHELEAWAHDKLASYRVSASREFFQCELSVAIDELSRLHVEQVSLWLDEFIPNCTIIENDAYVDPSSIYMLSDQCGEMPEIIVSAMMEVNPDEIKPALNRVYEKMRKQNSVLV